jgi:hypothetical protein
MHSLTRRYGCPYAEFRDAIPDEYFADPRHAFSEGAVYFSRRFAPVLVSSWRDLDGSHSNR